MNYDYISPYGCSVSPGRFEKMLRSVKPSEFEGWHLAPGIKVEFSSRSGVKEGVIMQLNTKQADIIVGGGDAAKVAYSKIRALEPVNADMTWQEAENVSLRTHFERWKGKIGIPGVNDYFFPSPFRSEIATWRICTVSPTRHKHCCPCHTATTGQRGQRDDTARNRSRLRGPRGRTRAGMEGNCQDSWL